MVRIKRVEYTFIDYMPTTLEDATVYISIRFRITAHLCLCGCGEKVVHPLRSNQWSLTYDGDTVSLAPSIGNTGIACRSHYWITRNQVQWLTPLTAALR